MFRFDSIFYANYPIVIQTRDQVNQVTFAVYS